MNNELFNKAQSLYDAKDFQGALMAFTQCLQDEAMPPAPGETGRLYHQIGNCLIKLRDANEAIQAYTQAVADPAYDMKGAVDCNLGMAYASLHDYDNAVHYFEAAVADEGYDARYKAYIGMGNAYMKVGKTAEAGVAFREAALDEGNPDPTKALLNLGVCFMALNRPADAVASYESAFQFDMPQAMKNKLNANLGQAYVACGEMAKAVTAFESAIADKTYYLSDSASVDYQRAVGAVAQGTSSQPTQVLAPVDMSGFDVVADGTAVYPEAESYPAEVVPQDPYYYDDGPMEGAPGYPEAYADGNDDRFFTASDEELEQWSRGIAKQERKRRNVGLKIVVAIIIVIILALGAAVFAYTQGYGFPTQESVAKELLANPSGSDALFSKDVEDVDSLTGPIVTDSSAEVLGVDKSMSNSTVYVKATTDQGGEVQYKISMVRDLIGWKISNVELYFPSQN